MSYIFIIKSSINILMLYTTYLALNNEIMVNDSKIINNFMRFITCI